MSDNSRLGTILDHTAYRDAVHVAIAPVTCDKVVQGGFWVRFTGPETVTLVDNSREPSDGFVDPLLIEAKIGQRFYVWLKPGIARNVRHEWDHPKFPKSAVSGVPQETVDKVITRLKRYAEAEDLFCCESDVTEAFYNVLEMLEKK